MNIRSSFFFFLFSSSNSSYLSGSCLSIGLKGVEERLFLCVVRVLSIYVWQCPFIYVSFIRYVAAPNIYFPFLHHYHLF